MTVLITYASKHGSTRGIAEAVGSQLRERGLETDVLPVGGVDDPERYDAVVIGSAVYFGTWRKEALAFIDRHAETLRRMPVWLFSSGPTGNPGAPVEPTDVGLLAKTQQRLDAIGPRDHHLFRGAADPAQMGVLERVPLKMAKMPLGDFRDWEDVRRWAETIVDRLAVGQV